MRKLLFYALSILALLLTGCASNQTIHSPVTGAISQQAMIGGNPNGDITLAFVYDYQCGYCHQMYPIVQQLIQEFPGLKIKMLPVAALHMTSLYEAAAAVSASSTNQFWNFTNQVMSQGPLSDDEVTALIKQMGLNTQQFQYTMHSKVVEGQLLEGQSLMDAVHHGPPLFFIYPSALDIRHSKVIVGAQPLEKMVYAIQLVQQKSAASSRYIIE